MVWANGLNLLIMLLLNLVSQWAGSMFLGLIGIFISVAFKFVSKMALWPFPCLC